MTRSAAVTYSHGGYPDGVRPQRVSIVGIPSEKGAGAAGTLMGPAALRTAGLPRLLADLGYAVVDDGDMPVPAPVMPEMDEADAARCLNLPEITAWTRAIDAKAHQLAREGIPVFLGGDHSISMGTIAGVARRCAETGKELVVLWLDAHADYNTPATTPSGNMHGMSLAYLCGDRSLAPLAGRRASCRSATRTSTSSGCARSTATSGSRSTGTGSTSRTCASSTRRACQPCCAGS